MPLRAPQLSRPARSSSTPTASQPYSPSQARPTASPIRPISLSRTQPRGDPRSWDPITAAGLSPRRIANNIARVFAAATPADLDAGHRWYPDARALAVRLAAEGGVTIETAAIVLAHLSPRTPWARTIGFAHVLLTNGEVRGAIGANVARARNALEAANPWTSFTATAPKTRAFAAAILGDPDAIAIDVWTARVAGIPHHDRYLRRVGFYDTAADLYRHVAHHYAITPTVLQAVTWTVIRGKPN
ncbi:hypothetical protein [Nocardia sp. NPDC020380]|uniref:DUF7178 family protein n=1 Tax=Nocardia sp. NPDC020380 TaxID=3364309 RepID=UPI0037945535